MNLTDIPVLSDDLFRKFTALLFQKCGITLKDYKKYLVINRLSKFVGKGRDFENFEDYYRHLKNDAVGSSLALFVNALTTNYSFFFRDKIHFDLLKEYLREKAESEPYIRLWSSACSTGEEPYSMAIVCDKILQSIRNIDIKILATDISTRVLDIAKKGFYQKGSIEGHVSKAEIKAYFDFDSGTNQYGVSQQLKDAVAFRYMNLFDSFPFRKLFDMVFLRNVLIYFDGREKETVIEKISEYIKPGGYLVLGLSETIFEIRHGLVPMKNSIYKKK
jgi:chemotaxis protein methyltransferase CheR